MKTKNIFLTTLLLLISLGNCIGQLSFNNDKAKNNSSVSYDSKLISEKDLILKYQLNTPADKEYFKFKIAHCPSLNEKDNNMGVYLAINPGNPKTPMTEAAIELFIKSLNKCTTPEAYWNSSIAYSKTKNYYRAGIYIEKFLNNSLTPELYKLAVYNKSIIEALNGDYYSSIADITDIIDNGYRKNNCYYNRGLAYAEVDSLDKAAKDFKKADRLFGSRGMGYVSYKLKKNEEALNYYKKAGFLNANATDDLNIGNLELALKKYNKAEKKFSRLIKNKEFVNESFYGKGMTYYYKNDKRKALDFFNIVINRDATFSDAYTGKGYVKITNGDYDNAIIDLQHSLNIKSWNLDAYKGLGVANYFSRNYNAALNCFETCKEIDSTYKYEYETYIIMARLYPVDTAKQLLQKAIDTETENYMAFAELGNLYFAQESYSDAINYYTKAIEKNDECKECFVNRGNAYFRNGDYENAINDFAKALKFDTTDINIYNGLGLAYSKADKFTESFESFKKAINLNPEKAELYNNLSLTYSQLGMYLNSQNNSDSAKKVFMIAHDTIYHAYMLGLHKIEYVNNNGLIYKEEKKYDEAIAEFDKMPFYACLNNRGIAKALKGQYKEAITDFDSAFTSMNPTRFEPIQNRREAAQKGNIVLDYTKEVHYNIGDFKKNKYQDDEYIGLYYYDSYNEPLPIPNYFLRKTIELKAPDFSSITENYLIFDTDKYKFKTTDKEKFSTTQKKNRKKMKIEKCVKG